MAPAGAGHGGRHGRAAGRHRPRYRQGSAGAGLAAAAGPETPGKQAVLITPSRALGRRVAAELLRWGIRVDDSAGVPLDQSPPGTFLLLTAHLVAGGAAPVTLLSALKHPLARGGLEQGQFRRLVRALERGMLRGPRLAGGLEGLCAGRAHLDPEAPWAAPATPQELALWLEGVVAAARPFTELLAAGANPLPELLAAHLGFAEWLAADESGDSGELWAKDAGAAARELVAELQLAGEVRRAGAAGRPTLPCSRS